MGFWKETGILANGINNHKCYEKAELLVKADGEILPKLFKFETISNEVYQETSSIIGEHITRSKTIYTPYIWLDFQRGARVRFADKQELIIKDIIEVQDNKKAISDGKGLIGLNIVF